MDEAEIIKIFQKYYAILERDYAPDKQLTILAAAHLTNAHVVNKTAALSDMNANVPVNVNLNAYQIESGLRDIKYILENISSKLH